jgi:hypothetical protein
MKRILLLAASHLLVLATGFALGIYLLPILAAPPAPVAAEVQAASGAARFHARFERGLQGSDALHWGEGQVTVGERAITLQGKLAPGPAYRLYLVPEFVDTGEGFQRLKARSLPLGDIRTFENFIVPVPAGTPLENYTTVLVWCESFSQFITAAKYR